MKKRALVTGGGGPAGISWETGIIVGLAEAGVNVRDADLFLGTSGGSCVAAQMTSDLTLDELFQRQVDPALQAIELPAQPDFERMEADFARILKDKILTTISSCDKILNMNTSSISWFIRRYVWLPLLRSVLSRRFHFLKELYAIPIKELDQHSFSFMAYWRTICSGVV